MLRPAQAYKIAFDRGVAEAEVEDPALIDSLEPPSPLSGEWAGESMVELLGDDHTPEVADAYETGFYDGWYEVAHAMVAARDMP